MWHTVMCENRNSSDWTQQAHGSNSDKQSDDVNRLTNKNTWNTQAKANLYLKACWINAATVKQSVLLVSAHSFLVKADSAHKANMTVLSCHLQSCHLMPYNRSVISHFLIEDTTLNSTPLFLWNLDHWLVCQILPLGLKSHKLWG